MYGDSPRRLSVPLLRRLERSFAALLATRRLASNQPLVERGEWLHPPQKARAHLPVRSLHLPAPALESRGGRRVQVAGLARWPVPDAPRIALGSTRGG